MMGMMMTMMVESMEMSKMMIAMITMLIKITSELEFVNAVTAGGTVKFLPAV